MTSYIPLFFLALIWFFPNQLIFGSIVWLTFSIAHRRRIKLKEISLKYFALYLLAYLLIGLLLYLPEMYRGDIDGYFNMFGWPSLLLFNPSNYFREIISQAITFYANIFSR